MEYFRRRPTSGRASSNLRGALLVTFTRALIAICCGSSAAATASAAIQPFSEFVQNLWAMPAHAYVGQSGTAVGSEAAFEEMRQYLVTLYDGVAPSHSFAIEKIRSSTASPSASSPLRGKG